MRSSTFYKLKEGDIVRGRSRRSAPRKIIKASRHVMRDGSVRTGCITLAKLHRSMYPSEFTVYVSTDSKQLFKVYVRK